MITKLHVVKDSKGNSDVGRYRMQIRESRERAESRFRNVSLVLPDEPLIVNSDKVNEQK